ncbi:MAG TPA: hypothetical protein VEC08_01450, partial [Nitrososphaerales archaeon]|nr:hypothetical protein [Nitrososphaerales archaeon]
MGKAHGSQEKTKVVHLDRETGREVVSKEVVRFYRYTQDADGKRSDYTEVSYEEAKGKVRFGSTDGCDWLVTSRAEKRYFDAPQLALGV